MLDNLYIPMSLADLPRHENEGLEKFSAALASGELAPGSTLTQAELCNRLEMSLSPLRETLVLLEEYGLVEIRPRAGIEIIDPELSFVRECYQFRIVIETAALSNFLELRHFDWITAMQSAQMVLIGQLENEGATDTVFETFLAQDHFIHSSIVASMNNKGISATHNRLLINIRTVRALNKTSRRPHELITAANEHLELLDKISSLDKAGAERCLNRHFEASTFRTIVNI